MPYGQPDIDEEARRRKAAENPLLQYFGGAEMQAKPAQPVAQGAPIGQPNAPQPPPQAATPAAPATNTGAGANTGNAAAQHRQAPTGFTNFSRVQAANRDVSQREAAAHGARATAKANAAQQSLEALRARFGAQVDAGTVPSATNPTPAAPGALNNLDPMSGVPIGPVADRPLVFDRSTAEMYGEGAKEYSGPGGLGDVEGVGDTYAATLAADENLGLLGDDAGLQELIEERSGGNKGSSAFSSGLIGSAGRKDFDALRARFNPEGDIERAETESVAQADAARGTSKANAAEWNRLGDEETARQKAATDDYDRQVAEKAAGDKKKKEGAEFEAKWQGAMAHDLDDTMNSNFESFNSVMSPLTQVMGQLGMRDAIHDYGTNLLSPSSGSQSGGGSRKIWWQPEHKEVYRQMDDSQWSELRALPQAAQARWLDTRKRELETGSEHAHFDATKDFGKNAFYGWKL